MNNNIRKQIEIDLYLTLLSIEQDGNNLDTAEYGKHVAEKQFGLSKDAFIALLDELYEKNFISETPSGWLKFGKNKDIWDRELF